MYRGAFPIDRATPSMVSPRKLKNAQMNMNICIPCQRNTKAKLINDASILATGMFVLVTGTYMYLQKRICTLLKLRK